MRATSTARSSGHRLVGLAAAIVGVVAATAIVSATPTKTTPAGKGAGSGSAAGSGNSAGSGSAASAAGSGAGSDVATAPLIDPATVPPADMPTQIRLRRIEQKVQALKERAWQIKASTDLLKEQTLGGGVGAQAIITHTSDMGPSFRLISLVYTLDGSQVAAHTEDSEPNLYKTKSFDVFAGPIAPGSHNLSVVAIYRGHGYGVFEYMSKYTFTVKSSHPFTASEGKITKVEGDGHELGGPNTPLEKRAAIDFKVTEIEPEKAPGTGGGGTTTVLPPATPTPASPTPTTPTPAPTAAPTVK